MKRLLRDGAATLVVLSALLSPAKAAELALKRVTLSSGGVGYFEYEASVAGEAQLTLDVPLNQVDDLLKSLVIYDASGRSGEITLSGREPLAQGFTDMPFGQAALTSTTSLLNALQGSDVRIGGDEPIIGQLLHAEDTTERSQDGSSETLIRVSILAEHGLRQAVLRDFDGIEFTDPALQAKLKTALNRVAAYRAQGRRQLTITTHGEGARTVRVGYVVGMPLWKATYRMVLSSESNAANVRLQGWAVLENFSGRDWSDVELTLLSGNPVTFRQALYESYYVPRPSVPVESGSHVLPPPDTGAFAEPSSNVTENTVPAAGMPRAVAKAMTVAAPPLAAAASVPAPAPPAPLPVQVEEAAAIENATQIAFTLPYKVNVAAGQSLVVPLIDRELPGARADLYQPATTRNHPLAAIELTNAAETGLPPGVLTLYQQGDHGAEYLGDARLAAFPAGEKRLLSYAVDNKVNIISDNNFQQMIVKATIAEGVMHLTRLQRRMTVYKIAASAIPGRLLIEQPKFGGMKLVEPSNVETTTSAYRIPAPLDDKGNGTVTVVEESPRDEAFHLVDLNDNQIGVYVAEKELDPKLRDALNGVAQRRQKISRAQTDLDKLNDERKRLTEDEGRLRDNYTAVKDDPGMRKSTLDKLKAADAALDDNAIAAAKATSTLSVAEAELASYINGLKL